MAQKTKKTAEKTPTKKLNDVQLETAKVLVGSKDTGVGLSNWNGNRKFPTRTLQVLGELGLAVAKEKKIGTGKEAKKETFWFPTAKTAKAIQPTA